MTAVALSIPIYILVLFVTLCCTTVVLVRLPPLLSSLLWLGVTFALTPLWIESSKNPSLHWDWFLWAKSYSVVLAVAWVELCRAIPERISPTVTGRSLWVILSLNILEAVMLDVFHGNYLNVAAGVLLCVSIAPRAANAAGFTVRRGCYIIELDIPSAWIVSYTAWNACFV